MTSSDASSVLSPKRRRSRRRFLAVEREILGGEPLSVPELRSSVGEYLRGRSPFYEEIEHTLFIAPGGRPRCAAMINRRWQRDKNQDAGFIGYFAAASEAAGETVEMLATASGGSRSAVPDGQSARSTAPHSTDSAREPKPSTRTHPSRCHGSRRTTEAAHIQAR